jgi:single-strand DNA-binding protein
MNQAILYGNVTKDPEAKTTKTGKNLTIFTIAVSSWKKDKEGNNITNFFKCNAWGKTAEVAAKYLTKGKPVLISGSIENTTWDKPDGTKGYGVNIDVSNLELIGSKNSTNNNTPPLENNNTNTETEEETEEDLPDIDVNDINIAMPF